jgi:hypothetical protein
VEVTLPAVSERDERRLGALEERAAVVAFGMGWRRTPDPGDSRVDGARLLFLPTAP